MKKNFYAVLLAGLLSPFFIQAQAIAKKAAINVKPAEVWEPLQLTENGSNVKSNVSFYILKGQCNAQDVIMLRMNNSNTHSVKVEWELSAQSGKTSVTVTPATDMQGSCNSMNGKKSADLVVAAPKTPEEDKQLKEYFLSHLTVTILNGNLNDK